MKGQNLRHEGHGDGGAEQGKHGHEARNASTETTAACNEASEKGNSLEEQSDKDEDPAKSPEEKLFVGGSVTSAATDERAGSVARIGVPSATNDRSSTSAITVIVTSAADVEKVPLGGVASSRDTARVGAEEIRLVKWCGRGQS